MLVKPFLAVAALMTATTAQAARVFDVTVNTSEANGIAAYADFQLVPLSADASSIAASVTNYAGDATNGGTPSYEGTGAGSLFSGASFTNSAQYNSMLQPLTLGNTVSFRLSLNGPGATAAGQGQSLFGLVFYRRSSYDANVYDPLLDNAGRGYVAKFTFDSGALSIDAPISPAEVPYANITEVAVVPEPGQWALLTSGFGLAGIAMRRRRNAVTA